MIPQTLYQAATKMLTRAYVPYSHFPVGAALLASNGQIYQGCNIENAAYGATNCAERTAFFAAIAAGQRDFQALLITSTTEDVIFPCGTCRQVMSEFCAPTMPVYLTNQAGKCRQLTVAELLPGAFSAEDLKHAK